MKTIKVYFKSKEGKTETITTNINGTKETIEKYYMGEYFNLGSVTDYMCKAYKIDFL